MRSASTVVRGTTKTFGLVTAAAIAVTGFGAGTANAAVVSGVLDCAPTALQTADGRVPGFAVPDGKMAKDRPQDIPTVAEMAAMEAEFAKRLSALSFDPTEVDIKDPININVYVHVIREDGTVEGGNIPRTWIRAQVKVLNHAFRGHGEAEPGARTPFKFELGGPDGLENGVQRITNADWYFNAADESVEMEMKSATRIGSADDLNLWTTGITESTGILGYATFPDGYDSNPDRDGVVIDAHTMPGGDLVPYHLGDTGTHEVGHWLGLYHTFEGGCTAPGDLVEDTPYEAEPFFGECSGGPRDSCAGDPGDDPIENFMDYSDDVCMDRFTVGQRDRSLEQWFAYRDGN